MRIFWLNYSLKLLFYLITFLFSDYSLLLLLLSLLSGQFVVRFTTVYFYCITFELYELVNFVLKNLFVRLFCWSFGFGALLLWLLAYTQKQPLPGRRNSTKLYQAIRSFSHTACVPAFFLLGGFFFINFFDGVVVVLKTEAKTKSKK